MSKSKQFQVSEFDIEIFKKLSQYYLTSKMLHQLVPTFKAKTKITSLSFLKERLRQLHAAGFINRDQRFSRGYGPNEYYYFLTKKSASFFEELENTRPGRGILKRLELGSQEHAFMIAELMLKLEKDIFQSNDQVKLIGYIRENHFEIEIPAQQKNQKKVYLKPDGTIFLQDRRQGHLLFLEVDLSTEPVSSVNPYRSSFKRKVSIYSVFRNHFKQHELINLFGRYNGYRVLFVCRTFERVVSLLDAARNMGKKDMFWFSWLDKIQNHNVLFDKIWYLPTGKTPHCLL